jgi:hypothetical protein
MMRDAKISNIWGDFRNTTHCNFENFDS